jgi:hypothetical protein
MAAKENLKLDFRYLNDCSKPGVIPALLATLSLAAVLAIAAYFRASHGDFNAAILLDLFL